MPTAFRFVGTLKVEVESHPSLVLPPLPSSSGPVALGAADGGGSVGGEKELRGGGGCCYHRSKVSSLQAVCSQTSGETGSDTGEGD